MNFKSSERQRAESEGGQAWMEMQSLKEKRKERERERMRDRSRGGREGLNFNPRVTEFTDICTRIRLAVPHGFSERTLSLLSLPKTYSSSYICRRMRPFTVLGGRERGKTELYVLNSSDARVTIHNPVCPPDRSHILYAFLWTH